MPDVPDVPLVKTEDPPSAKAGRKNAGKCSHPGNRKKIKLI